MVTTLRIGATTGTSLKSLATGFVLTKQTEGKSARTVEYYRDNLRRFLWYAEQQDWSDDVRLLTQWHVKQFLGYVGSSTDRWGLNGNGSESSKTVASYSTVRHYFVVLTCFLRWIVSEGFLSENPIANVHVSKPKPKVITPYSADEINKMLEVCDRDFAHNAKFLGSRNRAMILILLDTGVRLSELVGMQVSDVNTESGEFKVLGKGSKERVVRMGKVTRKALWKYMVYRSNDAGALWLTEEGKPIENRGVQACINGLKHRASISGGGSVHRFRHSFALNFLRADRNVFNLQYLLGHSDLDMVRRYTSALGMEDALKAHEKASPVDLLGIK